jgi:hypothetical protein
MLARFLGRQSLPRLEIRQAEEGQFAIQETWFTNASQRVDVQENRFKEIGSKESLALLAPLPRFSASRLALL